jgi:hypothetical protein
MKKKRNKKNCKKGEIFLKWREKEKKRKKKRRREFFFK